jgi:hypothetical protein
MVTGSPTIPDDGIDIASAGTDVADPRRAAAGSKFKYNFFEISEAVFFRGIFL